MSEEIGRYLRQARESIGLSLDQLQEKTKIQKPFLIAIENGDFEKLPSPFYVRTYLRSYANQVKVEPHHILRHYRKEEQAVRYGVQQNTTVMPAVGQQTGQVSLGQTTIQKPASSNRIQVHTALTIAKSNSQVHMAPAVDRTAKTQKLSAIGQTQKLPSIDSTTPSTKTMPAFDPGRTQTVPAFDPVKTQRMATVDSSKVNRQSRTLREQSMTIAKNNMVRSGEATQTMPTVDSPSTASSVQMDPVNRMKTKQMATAKLDAIENQGKEPLTTSANLSATMPGSRKIDTTSRFETKRDPRFERTPRFDSTKTDTMGMTDPKLDWSRTSPSLQPEGTSRRVESTNKSQALQGEGLENTRIASKFKDVSGKLDSLKLEETSSRLNRFHAKAAQKAAAEESLVPVSDTKTRREKFGSSRDEKEDSRYTQDVEALKTLSRSEMKSGRGSKSNKAGSKKWLLIAGIAGVLVLGASLIYAFSGSDTKNTSKQSGTTQVSPQQASKPEEKQPDSTTPAPTETSGGNVTIEKSTSGTPGVYEVSNGNVIKLSFKFKKGAGATSSGDIIVKNAAGDTVGSAFSVSTKFPSHMVSYTFSGDADKLKITITNPKAVEIMANGDIPINKLNPVSNITFLVKQ